MKQKEEGPKSRTSHAVAVVGKKAYVFGEEVEPRVPVDNKIHIFNLEDYSWSVADIKGAPPTPRVGITMVAVRPIVYIFGGRDKDHQELNHLYSFDTCSGEWKLISCDTDDLPHRETLPQLGEAVKLIEQQKEVDQISSEEGQKKKRMEKENRKEKIQKGADQILSEEAQEGQKKKRMERENRKKKRKKRACTPSLSQRNVIEGDSKKEHRCEIIGVSVAKTFNGTQQPSTPHRTETSPVEAQVRKNKHAKKKRKMGTKDLHILSPPQRKRSEPGSDLLAREDSNEVLAGDDSQTIMPNGNQSKVLTAKEIWELGYQYLAMETCLQMLTFIKDVCIDTLHRLKETIKQTHS